MQDIDEARLDGLIEWAARNGYYHDLCSEKKEWLKSTSKLEIAEHLYRYSSYRRTTCFPSELGCLQNLTHLTLKYLNFNEFPKPIFELENLKELEFVYCDFENVDFCADDFAKIQGLERLNLYGCNFPTKKRCDVFCELPKFICELKNLKKLNLAITNIDKFPAEFANLQGLEWIFFCLNPFYEFPKILCELKNLKSLLFEECEFNALPNELARLEKLERLDLERQWFDEFPQVIFELKSLKYLAMEEGLISPENAEKLRAKNVEIDEY